MIPKQIKKKTLAHYDRMIAWAETQKPRSYPFSSDMEMENGEWWGGEYCHYCEACDCQCKKCPLDTDKSL